MGQQKQASILNVPRMITFLKAFIQNKQTNTGNMGSTLGSYVSNCGTYAHMGQQPRLTWTYLTTDPRMKQFLTDII
jgi:hypothetical protein